ncbi:MAG: RNA pseudouridine synthase [Treponema sp.]|nr:RNA pseudouridine synthase [Treponema sp.]
MKPITPAVLAETPAYLVVFKPPRLHSVPLKRASDTATLLDWCAALYPETRQVCGKNHWEGGVLHRLDYETQGLVLVARTQDALYSLSAQQADGLFVKEYGAVVSGATLEPVGFPPSPARYGAVPRVIESGFRAFGPGRKAVRPVLGEGYRTEFVETVACGAFTCCHLRIWRGFRHQIRCHLAWLGLPIVNDALYGGANDGGELRLCAHAFAFHDPVSGEARRYTLDDSPYRSGSMTGVLSKYSTVSE